MNSTNNIIRVKLGNESYGREYEERYTTVFEGSVQTSLELETRFTDTAERLTAVVTRLGRVDFFNYSCVAF